MVARSSQTVAVMEESALPSKDFPRNDFPKTARVRKRADYLLLQQKGHVFSGRVVTIQWKKASQIKQDISKNDQQKGLVRLGITVTKKYGSAVERNRAKRLIREAFRLSSSHFSYVDINIRPKFSAKGQSMQVFLEDIELFFLRTFGTSNS